MNHRLREHQQRQPQSNGASTMSTLRVIHDFRSSSRAGVAQRPFRRGGVGVGWNQLISMVVLLLLTSFQNDNIVGRDGESGNGKGMLLVMAKNNKTPAPTPRPTSPTRMPSFRPTNYPTTKPSVRPTRGPSSKPTLSPTPLASKSPSKSPTVQPSYGPTSSPTIHPTTSVSPTSPSTPSPTKAPTAKPPTAMPTPSPPTEPGTPPPTVEEDLGYGTRTAVALPKISLEFTLDDNESTGTFLSSLKEDLLGFLENVLSTNGAIEDFDSVDMEFQIVQEALRGRKRTRRLDTGIRVDMEGVALFDVPPGVVTVTDISTNSGTNTTVDRSTLPTTEQLTQILQAYFSFWGTSDLTEDLQSFGLESVKDVLVFLDDTPVKVLTTGEGGDESQNDDGADPLQGLEDVQDGNGKTSKVKRGFLIALIALAVFVPFVVGMVIFQGKKTRQGGGRRGQSGTRLSATRLSGTPAPTGRIGARPIPSSSKSPRSNGGATSMEVVDYNMPDSDAISVDQSLYTTDGTISPPSQPVSPPVQYDPKRLDQVIAAAKQHSQEQAKRHTGRANE